MGTISHPIQTLVVAVITTMLCAGCASLDRGIRSDMAGLVDDGASFGLLVVDVDTRARIVSLNARARFLPASNVKLLTTAAALDHLEALDAPDSTAGASVLVIPVASDEPPDLVLQGRGDARLSDADDCTANCLAQLADAVAASGLTQVRRIIGDDSLFANEPYAHGWSWEDFRFGYGAGASALNVNDNTVRLEIAPADKPGDGAHLSWTDGANYFAIDNRVTTVNGPVSKPMTLNRQPGSRWIEIAGEMPVNSAPRTLVIGVESPAQLAAWRFRQRLEARGVAVLEGVHIRHQDDDTPDCSEIMPLASLEPAPLIEGIAVMNKDSNNLHAEVLLRRLGRIEGRGSVKDGLGKVTETLGAAGAPAAGFDIHDGSGMSVYNRLSPEAVMALLLWAHDQDWGDQWRDSLAVAGVDGTLRYRFIGSALEGRLFAKSGSLNGTNALSGYMIASSGRLLAFSFFVNDRASVSGSALDEMEAALVRVAASQ